MFQKIDGVDVAIFAMTTQEYGSECPAPNTRHIYISYLDSVRYFEPSTLRRQFHHELILGYLKYVKYLGFEVAHIWACPAPQGNVNFSLNIFAFNLLYKMFVGDDYIFNRHPENMKFPNDRKLQAWYKEMFKKGVERNIILQLNVRNIRFH